MVNRNAQHQKKRAIYKSIFLSFIIIVGFFALVLSFSNLNRVRYQTIDKSSDLKAIGEAIFFHTGSVDIVFSGTSRMRRGIYVPYMKKALSPYFGGRDPIIYDLGIPGKGPDANVRILLDLLEKRDVKFIFMLLYQAFQEQLPTHPNLRKIGKLEDILLTPIKKNCSIDLSLTHRSQLLYKRISEMFDICIDPLDPLKCIRISKSIPAKSIDTSPPKLLEIDQLLEFLKERKSKRNGNYFKTEEREHDFDDGHDYRTGYYLDLLIKKARIKGTTVVLMDIPNFEWNTVTNGFPTYVKERFGVDYLYLTREEILDLGKYGFADHGHVNVRGEKTIRKMIIRYFESKNEGINKVEKFQEF